MCMLSVLCCYSDNLLWNVFTLYDLNRMSFLWRFGVAVTTLSASTKLTYVGPG